MDLIPKDMERQYFIWGTNWPIMLDNDKDHFQEPVLLTEPYDFPRYLENLSLSQLSKD